MALPDDFEDAAIYPVLDELRMCLCLALGPDATPCFCGIIVGEGIPVEYAGDCEDCGAAYVRLVTAFPSNVFPVPDQEPRCTAVMAYTVAVGIARCLPAGRSNGEPPTPDEVEEAARQALADMQAIRQAIRCCFGSKFEDLDHVLGTFTPAPAGSGVSGGEMVVTISEQF